MDRQIVAEFLDKIKNIVITPALLESYLMQYVFEDNANELMKNINILIETANKENTDRTFEETTVNMMYV